MMRLRSHYVIIDLKSDSVSAEVGMSNSSSFCMSWTLGITKMFGYCSGSNQHQLPFQVA
jgi:hypothetical protein